ncbi:protein-tyrosine phosphatase domain-containing protein [Ditylenchus destructor]|nr:protein-tyrosine phosphatase domain-containing protein [Ditylenchus destructor]
MLRVINLCDKDRYPFDVKQGADEGAQRCIRYSRTPIGGYINASPVDITVPGRHPVNLRFIASMAPTKESIPDFWQMIWDESVSVVVMLTVPTEGLVEKCAQYWPEKPNTPLSMAIPSQLQVTLTKAKTKNYGHVRKFTVTHTENAKTRKLTQYHFTQWPDLGVPKDYTMFLQFMRDVKKASKNSSSRTLVHCSQGTGRTGTFLMAYTILHRMEANLSIYPKEIRQIVEHLRECRQGCVETKEQYYIGKVMIDLLEKGKISPLVKA